MLLAPRLSRTCVLVASLHLAICVVGIWRGLRPLTLTVSARMTGEPRIVVGYRGAASVNRVMHRATSPAPRARHAQSVRKQPSPAKKPQKRIAHKAVAPKKAVSQPAKKQVREKIERVTTSGSSQKLQRSEVTHEPPAANAPVASSPAEPVVAEVSVGHGGACDANSAAGCLTNALIAVWRPPKGVRAKRCTKIRARVETDGGVADVAVITSSGIPAFDVAARHAVTQLHIPRGTLVAGQVIEIAFQ